jgi:hypothetical protein
MAIFLSSMKMIRLPLMLFILDVFVMGQGVIALITFFVILFKFLPKSLAGLIEKDKEKLKKYSVKLAIYIAMVVAIILGLSLNNKIAEHRSEIIITALEKYNAQYQHYPDKLDELIPEFLPKIPMAKINLLGQFHYYNFKNDKHSLMYMVIPPFGRAFYSLEEKKWSYLD